MCRGVAIDVFHADQARRLLEEIDGYVEVINETGLGKVFFGNLQRILEWDLCLSLTRLFERYSSQNPNRSIGAAIHFISSHAGELRIPNRARLIDSLVGRDRSHLSLDTLEDKQLSLAVVQKLREGLPTADSSSENALDQALANLKRVRDKAIAHHDRVDKASLMVPAWPKLVELVEFSRQFVLLVATSYLSVSHNLEYDAGRSASSLRQLLEKAGLTPGSEGGGDAA